MRLVPLAATLAALVCALAPAAQAQSDAPGDSYTGAFRLNPGTGDKPGPIAEPAGASFSADTTNYGTQGDIFSPPGSGGGPEPNICRPARYGKTAWAWLYTPRWVQADVRASAGFDPVIALMPFRAPSKPVLNARGGICSNLSTSTTETLGDTLPIVGPGWYAVQVGGVGATGGSLATQVHLLPPPAVHAVTGIAARRSSGAALVSLHARVPKGARVFLRCLRQNCGRLKGVASARDARTHTYLRGKAVPDGARLELRVTARGYIGFYSAWDVKKGALSRAIVRCMEPSSSRPRATCDG
jgi:hypothetical protein